MITEHDHLTKFQYTRILSTVSNYMDRLIREATEFELYPKDMKREDGETPSGSWKPLIRLLEESRRSCH